ncbi:FMN-dependent NADH-azoreductase [Streptomyces neyagawaensis]|uniref:FMN dependent NADH:quinone oxidoreductase n=1 Tax=Streptomyces neyagawaensis TaxID=42238 RepID=A0ABV3B314_9ACTN
MHVLRIDSSIQGPASASSELADLAEAAWTEERPDTTLTRRHLGTDPLPADVWATAATAGYIPAEHRSEAHNSALALAGALADELRAADAAILALPLYNYGVSQHVKSWIDLVIAGGSPSERFLDGKPVILLTTRGGSYAPGTPREGWDHNVSYLTRILADLWGADLTVIEREFTLVGVNPALDQFTEAAALMKKAAHEAAAAAGRVLATR